MCIYVFITKPAFIKKKNERIQKDYAKKGKPKKIGARKQKTT